MSIDLSDACLTEDCETCPYSLCEHECHDGEQWSEYYGWMPEEDE